MLKSLLVGWGIIIGTLLFLVGFGVLIVKYPTIFVTIPLFLLFSVFAYQLGDLIRLEMKK